MSLSYIVPNIDVLNIHICQTALCHTSKQPYCCVFRKLRYILRLAIKRRVCLSWRSLELDIVSWAQQLLLTKTGESMSQVIFQIQSFDSQHLHSIANGLYFAFQIKLMFVFFLSALFWLSRAVKPQLLTLVTSPFRYCLALLIYVNLCLAILQSDTCISYR